jgi:outer membrane protein OmpA-like peptidoglycan-associated protein
VKGYFILIPILFLFACESAPDPAPQGYKEKEFNEEVQFSDSITEEEEDANWSDPVFTPVGPDITRIIRGYYLVGEYDKMLEFVIVPGCYEQKQIEYALRKSTWGYETKLSNLKWQPDSTFILTCTTMINNTKGSEQYVGKVINDTAKLYLFPEKADLFPYYGDEDLADPCALRDALDNVYFKFGKAEFLPESKRALKTILNYLVGNPLVRAHFIGHASSEGNSAANFELSQKRAKAICDYLIQRDILSERLTSEGKGDSMPIFPNDTEGHRASNRRVEIILTKR